MIGVGSKLSDYELIARLAHGGMATLYVARRAGAAGFSRHVAVKVVHPHLADDEKFVRMFINEAKLSARIQDPNVVHVEELGKADGTFFIVMEYVHGCPLSKLIRELRKRKRRLSVELVTYIGIKVADGLHAAHEVTDSSGKSLGIVHRDVSPQNVLLAYRGHVKLIDFGVAKAKGTHVTEAGSLKGKLRYMAPEQAHSKELDRRSDIFALGIVLWEMLTMRRLFDADNDLGLLDQVRAPEIVPPGSLVDGIPPALDAAVMCALSVDRGGRPSTAKELRRLLAEACPKALAVEASDLAQLMRAVMKERIEEQEKALPESVSGVLMLAGERGGLIPSEAPAQSVEVDIDVDLVLGTMTQSAESLMSMADDGSGERSGSASQPGSGIAEVPRPGDAAPAGAAPKPVAVPKPQPAAEPADVARANAPPAPGPGASPKRAAGPSPTPGAKPKPWAVPSPRALDAPAKPMPMPSASVDHPAPPEPAAAKTPGKAPERKPASMAAAPALSGTAAATAAGTAPEPKPPMAAARRAEPEPGPEPKAVLPPQPAVGPVLAPFPRDDVEPEPDADESREGATTVDANPLGTVEPAPPQEEGLLIPAGLSSSGFRWWMVAAVLAVAAIAAIVALATGDGSSTDDDGGSLTQEAPPPEPAEVAIPPEVIADAGDSAASASEERPPREGRVERTNERTGDDDPIAPEEVAVEEVDPDATGATEMRRPPRRTRGDRSGRTMRGKRPETVGGLPLFDDIGL